MSSRRKRLLSAVAGAIVLVALAVVLLLPRGLGVKVVNASQKPLEGLVLLTTQGNRTPVPGLTAGESVTVRPQMESGPVEGELLLLDSSGRMYVVLGYYTGQPQGEIVVTVDAQSDRGITGTVSKHTDQSTADDLLQAKPEGYMQN